MLCILFVIVVTALLGNCIVVADLPPEIDALFQRAHFSGTAAMRRSPTDFISYQTYGKMDFQFGAEMPFDAQFPIASNTKLLTAIALYQLQERGLVKLSDSVAKYLDATDFIKMGLPEMTSYCPTLANSTTCQTITFEQLLAMTSGMDSNDWYPFEPYLGSIAAILGQYYITLPLKFVPGTQYFYSNPAFMFCGYFVEKFSGMALGDYFKKYIFDVVGMEHSRYNPSNERYAINPKRINEFYQFFDNTTDELLGTGKCILEFDVGSVNAAGGAVSTMDDEALLYYTLFNFTALGKPLFNKPESFWSLIQPRIECPPPPINISYRIWYAQGLYVIPDTIMKIPQFVLYPGALVCAHTSNLLDLRVSPPVLTQAFSNTQVYFTSKKEYAAVTANGEGFFYGITGGWGAADSVSQLSWNWHDYFYPPK